jgi:Flp pilus assembly protein CpaB
MGRRPIAILLLVGGLVILVVVAVVLLLNRSEEPNDVVVETSIPVTEGEGTPGTPVTSAPEAAEGAPEGTPRLVPVVVSVQTVPRGWQMTTAELEVDLRRSDFVGDNVITSIDDVVGKYARTDIFQGQTVTNDLLVSDPRLSGIEDYGPSSLIPEGFVAQAVPMDRLSSVAYGFDNGDFVDIMVTFMVAEVDPEFQTLLRNSASFILEEPAGEEGTTVRQVYTIPAFGRFDELPTGDLGLVLPSEETQRPMRVSIILQGAKVVNVGTWSPADAPSIPTPTPTPNPEATPTPEAGAVPTATPTPPDVVLLALSPQQQLFLRYALDVGADVDYALRSVEDGQVFSIENVDLTYTLQRFNIEIPVDFEYTVEPVLVTVTPPPAGEGDGGQ